MIAGLLTIRRRFLSIRRATPRLASEALLVAWDDADQAERQLLLDIGLANPVSDVLKGFMRRAGELTPGNLDHLSRSIRERPIMLHQALDSPSPQLRGGALRVMECLDDPRLLELLRGPLADERLVLRTAAGQLLQRFVRRLMATDTDVELRHQGARDAASMFASMPMAPDRVLAWSMAVLAPSLGREAEKYLARAPRARVAVLGEILAKSQEGVIQTQLDWWVGIPTVSREALNGLKQISKHGRVLAHAENLIPRQTRLAVLSGESSLALQQVAERYTPAMIGSIASDEAQAPELRVALLADLVGHGALALRSLALRHLIALADRVEDAERVVERYLHDPSPELARTAMQWLIPHARDRRVVHRALRSPHTEVRSLAGGLLAPGLFTQLCREWRSMTADQRLQKGRALYKLDSRLVDRLNKLLGGTSLDQRLLAIGMIRELQLCSLFEPKLIELVDTSDKRAASAAVAALGDLNTKASRQAVVRALKHENGRVRANAVEALGVPRHPTHAKHLLRLTGEGHNRVRANAIASLIGTSFASKAEASLRTMLADQREKHRLSAIWVAKSQHVESVAPRLVELASSDPSIVIRERAHEAVGDVIARIERQTRTTANLLGAA